MKKEIETAVLLEMRESWHARAVTAAVAANKVQDELAEAAKSGKAITAARVVEMLNLSASLYKARGGEDVVGEILSSLGCQPAERLPEPGGRTSGWRIG